VSLCSSLRTEAAGIWQALHDHPFVREVAAGTLPPEKFRFYLEQNVQYLPEYARAMAIGASKADGLVDMGAFAAALSNIVDNEIPENQGWLDQIVELGAEDAGGSEAMAPANVAYTSYLVSAAYVGGPLEVMTALMPCAWSYGDIARSFGEVADHPVYSTWVEFFRSDRYAGIVDEMRAQLETLAADVTPAQQRRLSEIFRMGARLEWGFWEMGYTLAQWPDIRVARPVTA
jgi:thiaminase (transcriptional activator TenA)